MRSEFKDLNSKDIIIIINEYHRKGGKGGGLALIAKHNLKVKREEHRITAELEYVKWKSNIIKLFP